jgi:flagellar assembly protein FliH
LSRVIRADEVEGLRKAFNLVDFEREARDILARAQARADEMLAEARSRSEEIAGEARSRGLEEGRVAGHKSGEEAGRKAGREEGLAVCRQDTATLAATLETMVADFGSRRERLIKEAERDLLLLSVRIAERVLRRELRADASAAASAAAEAISLAADRSRVEVRINPADEAAVSEGHAELGKRFSDLQDISLVPDPGVERGGCLVSTASGEVDLQVETQLERIAALLVGDTSGEGLPRPEGEGR